VDTKQKLTKSISDGSTSFNPYPTKANSKPRLLVGRFNLVLKNGKLWHCLKLTYAHHTFSYIILSSSSS